MQSILLENAMILWTPSGAVTGYESTEGKVEIVAHPPDSRERTKIYSRSYGACNFDDWRKPEERLLRLYVLFDTLTVCDGMDPWLTHEAFLAIPEYRQNISPDQFGATYIGDGGVERLKRGENPFNQTNLEATRAKQESAIVTIQENRFRVFIPV